MYKALTDVDVDRRQSRSAVIGASAKQALIYSVYPGEQRGCLTAWPESAELMPQATFWEKPEMSELFVFSYFYELFFLPSSSFFSLNQLAAPVWQLEKMEQRSFSGQNSVISDFNSNLDPLHTVL